MEEGRGPLEKRGLIIISNRVPEHPRFTGLTHVRTPPRGHVREGFRVLSIETRGWNFNYGVNGIEFLLSVEFKKESSLICRER